MNDFNTKQETEKVIEGQDFLQKLNLITSMLKEGTETTDRGHQTEIQEKVMKMMTEMNLDSRNE